MAIEVRTDSGFAVPAVYDYCEAERVAYTMGLVPNARPEGLAAPLLAEARRQQAETGAEKVRLAGEVAYQAEGWTRPRRVVFKAEALAKGQLRKERQELERALTGRVTGTIASCWPPTWRTSTS